MKISKAKLIKNTKRAADWLYNNRAVIVLSIAIGGYLSMYIINLCRTNFILAEEVFNVFLTDPESAFKNVDITDLELIVYCVSAISLVIAPLCFDSKRKIKFAISGLIGFIFAIDLSMFLRMFISQRIDNAFVAAITFTCIYFVWVCLELLKLIYHWLNRNLKG